MPAVSENIIVIIGLRNYYLFPYKTLKSTRMNEKFQGYLYFCRDRRWKAYICKKL